MLALLAESKLNGKKYFEFCQKLSFYNYYANANLFYKKCYFKHLLVLLP